MSDQRLPFAGEVWVRKDTGYPVKVERVVPGPGEEAVRRFSAEGASVDRRYQLKPPQRRHEYGRSVIGRL